jgi:hypothetical protein
MSVSTSDWIAIAGAALPVLVGGGALARYLDRRASRRKEHQDVLNDFLLPLESILKHNQQVHASLTGDSDLRSLEYSPELLQRFFAGLPPADARRATWKGLIDGLISDNRRAKLLIQENAGHLPSDLRQRSMDFLKHADEWAALWQASLGHGAVADADRYAGRLSTPAFPAGFDGALAEEIARRRALAGIKAA